jgi:16S rRNA (uracil1498-N3)-methyltransferase
MPRFFVPSPLPVAGPIRLTGAIAHRIGRVLRLASGEPLSLFDGEGREVAAVLVRVSPREVIAEVRAELPPPEPEPVLHLYQALIRPNRFEWLLEKATELGAGRITPVVGARCRVRTEEFGPSRLARWRRIVVEASEQCGRGRLPELGAPLPFAAALADAAASAVVVLPWEGARADAPPLGEVARMVGGAADPPRPHAGRVHPARRPLAVFIGPEGGFAPEEVAAARTRGALLVSLGPRVLRAETAALAALAIAGDALRAAPHLPVTSPAEERDSDEAPNVTIRSPRTPA